MIKIDKHPMKNIPFSPPDIGEDEIQAVVETLKSGWITTGPKTKDLEQKIAEYIGVSKAVCLNSATAAMELTLRVLGIGPGDEVITTAYTYTATASIVSHVGAKLVLIDTAAGSYEMDYDQLEEKITKKTKLIIPVEIGGKVCNYKKIYELIERKKHLYSPSNKMQEKFERIIVMSDAAHAFGAMHENYNCGQIADFTCFSFHAVKNLTTAEGGAVVWKNRKNLDDNQLYKEYMLLSLHGQSKDALAKTQIGAWEYDVIYPAYKCNMTDIMASIGIVQLSRYSESLLRRKEIIEKYDKRFLSYGLYSLKHYEKNSFSSGHLYLLNIPWLETEDERNQIIIELAHRGITANVHYKPLPMLTAYKNMGFDIEDFPNAYNAYKNEISLPLHTLLTDEEVEYICENLIEILNEAGEKKYEKK